MNRYPLAKVTLETYQGPVDCEAEVPMPGLAVHHSHFTVPARRWTITHISSGLALVDTFPSRQAAIEVCQALGLLWDWTLPYPEVRDRMPLEVIPKVRAAYAQGMKRSK